MYPFAAIKQLESAVAPFRGIELAAVVNSISIDRQIDRYVK